MEAVEVHMMLVDILVTKGAAKTEQESDGHLAPGCRPDTARGAVNDLAEGDCSVDSKLVGRMVET